MVVFKKRCTPVTNATSQGQKQKDKIIPIHEAATSAQLKQQVGKAIFGALRYSDMVAERKSTLNVSPIKKLVNTFELFEQVLDYLPMKEVLLATRVCHAFKTNIENSSLLQAKLFLAPDLTLRKMAVSSSGTLLSGVRAEQHIAARKAADPSQDSKGGEIELYILHPALRAGCLSERYMRRGMVQYAQAYTKSYHFVEDDLALTFRNRVIPATLPATSNLNRMFLSQPPMKEVEIRHPVTRREGRPEYLTGPEMKPYISIATITIRKGSGVTFGDVLMVARSGSTEEVLSSVPIYVSTRDGFVVNAKARSVAEAASELSWEDDPTRWVFVSWVRMKDGCFAFT